MAEAFVRTLKRDYVRIYPTLDARTVIEQLPSWLAHPNEVHPHRALGHRSPREYIAQTPMAVRRLRGSNIPVGRLPMGMTAPFEMDGADADYVFYASALI